MNILLLDKTVYVVLIYVVNQLYLEQKLTAICELCAMLNRLYLRPVKGY